MASFWPTNPNPPSYVAPYISPSILSTTTPHAPTLATLRALDTASSPLLTLRSPLGWPDPSPSFTARVQTEAQLAWNDEALHCVYRITGPFKLACDDPAVKESRMKDSRVELFVCPDSRQNDYLAFELNSAGRALDFRATLTSATSASLDFAPSFRSYGTHSPPSSLPADCPYTHLYTLSIPWPELTIEPPHQADAAFATRLNERDMRVAVLRGEVVETEDGTAAYPHTHCWSTVVDPLSIEVTFHTTRVFLGLRFRPPR